MHQIYNINSAETFFKAPHCIREKLGQRGHRSGILYRGHRSSEEEYKLLPKLFRKTHAKVTESDVIFNFGNRHCLRTSTPCTTIAEQIAMIQHYGGPTRLLDWSESFLVAAYFAIVEPMERCNGIDDVNSLNTSHTPRIWALDAHRLVEINDKKSQAQGLPPVGFKQLEGHPHIQSFVHDCGSIYPVWPSHRDPRMVAQQGVFTLHTTKRALEDCAEYATALVQIDIAPQMRKPIAYFLAASGLTQQTYFPDIDHLCAHLQRSWLGLGPVGIENIDFDL